MIQLGDNFPSFSTQPHSVTRSKSCHLTSDCPQTNLNIKEANWQGKLKARKKNEWTNEKCSIYVDLINLHALMFVYPELHITETILVLPGIWPF
jgi:hypothetical protein